MTSTAETKQTGMGLTAAEKAFLEWLPQDSTKWRTVHIDRSGCSKHLTAARQKCAAKGLAVMSQMLRRTWRITDSGRAALSKAEGRTT